MKIYLDKITEYRKNSGLTVGEIAAKLGVGVSTYWSWEKGRRNPKATKLRKLAKILKISISDISSLEVIEEHEDIPDLTKEISKSGLMAFADEYGKELHKRQQAAVHELFSINNELINVTGIIKALIDGLELILYVKDINLKYKIANKAFLKNLGLPNNIKISGKEDIDFFSVKEARENTEEDKHIIETFTPINQKESYIFGSRKKRRGLISKFPIFTSEGKISGLIAIITDITQRHIEHLIHGLIEKALNKSTLCVAITAAALEERKVLYMSDSYEQVYGFSKNNFLKDSSFMINNCAVYDENFEITKARVKSALQKQTAEKLSYKIKRPDGEIRNIKATLSPILLYNKPYFCWIEEDVTEQLKNKQLNELLQINIYSMNDGLVITDLSEERFIYYNQAFKDILERNDNDLSQNKIANFFLNECIHKEDLALEKEYFKNHSWPSIRKLRLVTPDKKVKWVEISRTGQTYQGKNCGVASYREITDIMLLKKEKEMLLDITNSTGNVIYWQGYYNSANKFCFTYINDAVKNITGYPRKQFYNNEITIKKLIITEHLPLFRENIIKASNNIIEFEFKIINKFKKEVWLAANINSKIDKTTEQQIFYGSYTDITEKKQLEIELLNYTKELEHSLTEKIKADYTNKLTKAGVSPEEINRILDQ